MKPFFHHSFIVYEFTWKKDDFFFFCWLLRGLPRPLCPTLVKLGNNSV